MADDADRAQLEIDAELEHARRTARRAPKLLATGCCHNCDEPLHDRKQLFCDNDCSEDYEARERARAMQHE
jgi:hypothetical protein